MYCCLARVCFSFGVKKISGANNRAAYHVRMNSMKKWFALALSAMLVAVDQIIKNWALTSLVQAGQIEVVPRLFNLTYIENRGAAFGILQGKTVPLIIITGLLLLTVICAVALGYIKSNFLLWTVCIGLAGGVGNLYDRITRGFVVDYLDFSALFGFPVFNFADCCVVSATILILIYVIKSDIELKKKPVEQ